MTIVIFILILGLLVFVHELGHYTVARRNGVGVREFGFGFPPRIVGFVKDEKNGKYRIVWGRKHIHTDNTIYSLNWIPLGGFVHIKGEEGKNRDEDSFAVKSAWIRIKILAAGVTMNFILAWVLISITFMIGAPQAAERIPTDKEKVDVMISQVVKGAPADVMGIKPGDNVRAMCISNGGCKTINRLTDLQNFVALHKGEQIAVQIMRGENELRFTGVPRVEFPANEGALGVGLVETSIVQYPWYKAIFEGLMSTVRITGLILVTFGDIIKTLLIGEKVTADLAGPVGIAYLTKQFTDLGFVYLLNFAALLSINLGIINILPIPALDGGRIIFILIEKLKGSPVNEKVEQTVHGTGFMLLLLLMVIVTIMDFTKFGIFDKIKNLF